MDYLVKRGQDHIFAFRVYTFSSNVGIVADEVIKVQNDAV